jgi:hypothetical protein
MKTARVASRLGIVFGVLAAASGFPATSAFAQDAPPVEFAVAKQDP